jgi:hypothetical protein
LLKLVIERKMEGRIGSPQNRCPADSRAGALMRASRALGVGGTLGAVVLVGRSRALALLSGAALLAGSVCARFAIFEADQESARDPASTVAPQRQRLDSRAADCA